MIQCNDPDLEFISITTVILENFMSVTYGRQILMQLFKRVWWSIWEGAALSAFTARFKQSIWNITTEMF